MCGRTASTLSPSALVQACSYNPAAVGTDNKLLGGKAVGDTTGQDEVLETADKTEEEESDTSSTLVPVWTEAPCGGQYFPSTNIPPTSYTAREVCNTV